jgi:hypothetical protein
MAVFIGHKIEDVPKYSWKGQKGTFIIRALLHGGKVYAGGHNITAISVKETAGGRKLSIIVVSYCWANELTLTIVADAFWEDRALAQGE